MDDDDDGDYEGESPALEILVGSIESVEQGYGDNADGRGHDGYTSKELQLRGIAGVGGKSMETGDLAISEYMEQLDEHFSMLDGNQDTRRSEAPGSKASRPSPRIGTEAHLIFEC